MANKEILIAMINELDDNKLTDYLYILISGLIKELKKSGM